MISARRLRDAGFSGLRVVGDVHGEAEAFEAAIAGAESLGLFIIQLGDLVDYGPDSPGVLRRAFAMLDAKRGIFLLGNHEHKLRRALIGHASAKLFVAPEGLGKTLEQSAPTYRHLLHYLPFSVMQKVHATAQSCACPLTICS